MSDFMIGGHTFNVLIEGSENKPVLMLANPLGTSLHFWDPLMPALHEHFRTLRCDARGHGATTAETGPYGIDDLGRDALAIMDALGIEKAHFLGLSKGSLEGLWLLANAPERIGRAVLAGAAAQIGSPDLWNSRIKLAREGGMEAVAEAAAGRWFTRQFREAEPEKAERVLSMLRSTPVRGYIAACAAIRDADLREAIRGIKNKVLVIAGRHDPSTPPGLGALVASAIEGAQFVTLDTSHMLPVEDEANFTKAVIEFLTAPETAAAKAPVRRRAPAKKAAAKRAPAKKAAPRKAAAKKAAAKKSLARKAPAKKRARPPQKKTAAAKKAAAKKLPAKKAGMRAAAKKTGARKAAAKRKMGAAKKKPGKKIR
jgi:3-oxoadipate enol-lactonase